MGIIYMITAPDNRKYIGETTEPLEVKWKEHVKTCRKNYKGECRVLNNAIKKFGDKHFNARMRIKTFPEILKYGISQGIFRIRQ